MREGVPAGGRQAHGVGPGTAVGAPQRDRAHAIGP
jgi:hypothetical protein